MKRTDTQPEGRTRWLRLGGVVLVVCAVATAAVLGWRWHRSIPVQQVVVEGAHRAAPTAVKDLARVEAGQPLYRLQPRLVADRAERHPWVAHASVRRTPGGTLHIAVTERTPAALVMQDGEAAYYLDAAGYPLPLSRESGRMAAGTAAGTAAYDVPLVRGLGEAFQPLRPTAHAPLRALLTALHADADAAALVSEIRASGGSESLRLRTVPSAGHSAEVRLGTGAFPEKLRRLDAFWAQAVRRQTRTAFHGIDLRFGGRVVARQETLASASSSDS